MNFNRIYPAAIAIILTLPNAMAQAAAPQSSLSFIDYTKQNAFTVSKDIGGNIVCPSLDSAQLMLNKYIVDNYSNEPPLSQELPDAGASSSPENSNSTDLFFYGLTITGCEQIEADLTINKFISKKKVTGLNGFKEIYIVYSANSLNRQELYGLRNFTYYWRMMYFNYLTDGFEGGMKYEIEDALPNFHDTFPYIEFTSLIAYNFSDTQVFLCDKNHDPLEPFKQSSKKYQKHALEISDRLQASGRCRLYANKFSIEVRGLSRLMHIETAGEGTYALFSMDGVDIVGNDMRLTVMHLLNSADRI